MAAGQLQSAREQIATPQERRAVSRAKAAAKRAAQEAELKELMAGLDRKLDDLEAHTNRMLANL